MDAHPAVPLTFDAVTTFAPQHWESHARRCVETFTEHWPKSVRLRFYRDEQLENLSPWLTEFKQRHRHRPTDNYRFDAVRFAHKVAAIQVAYQLGKADYLIWIDADCVTHAPVDEAWLTEMAQGADFAYLKRKGKYSECGWLMFRRGAAASALIANLCDLYRTDELFDLAEWHDSWAFDHVRKWMEDRGLIRCASLSGGHEASSHPLVNGPLGSRFDHLKGRRKAEGRSRKSDLTTTRTEPYWNG